MNKRHGFTQAELMVVILVIAILAALLVPVLVRAQRVAEKETCLANVRAICQATLMYAADYNQTLPWAAMDYDDAGFEHALPGEDRYAFGYAGQAWLLPDVVRKYVADNNIWVCPTLSAMDPNAKLDLNPFGANSKHPELLGMPKVGVTSDGFSQQGAGGSYGYVCMHHAGPSEPRAPLYGMLQAAQTMGLAPQDADYRDYHCCGTPLASFGTPANHVMVFCDSFGVHEGYRNDYADEHFAPPQFGGKNPAITGGTTLGFVDGHASYERFGWTEALTAFVKRNAE